MAGGRLEELHLLREAGAKEDFFKKDAAMNSRSRVPIASWHGMTERWRQEAAEAPETKKVGVCQDPESALMNKFVLGCVLGRVTTGTLGLAMRSG